MVTGMAHGDFAQSAARAPSGQVPRHGSDPFRQPIAKIISGGQTGADRGAIDLFLPAPSARSSFYKVFALEELPAKE